MKRALGLTILLVACDPGGPQDPEPSRVSVVAANPLAIELDAPLRATLVWTYRDGPKNSLATSADVPAWTDGLVPFPLRMPKLMEKLDPIEQLALGYQTYFPMHRPRIVIYEDVNRNERFDANVFDITGPDLVRGIDGGDTSIGAVLDIEAVIEALPPEEVGSYYQASGGRFSPFVSVMDEGYKLGLGYWRPSIPIVLDDSDFPRSSIECMRPKVGFGTSTRLHVVLDAGIDPSACGTNAVDCKTSSLATLPAPSLESYESESLLRQVSCNQVAPLEALLIGRGTIICQSCMCTGEVDVTAYVANQASLPSWWPCGKTVDFCSAASSITDYERFCSTQ